ncbi:Cytoplasmic tRNA 2-thiolation protein 2 [Taphrina deformans PYCC 5710]|uniref:Cytoplasmic tRNA 2-thiolation protein 2 n=1 Tax=Taphrina deformans (strain PYCC 5710 / ATCC 11124 / CBS 356.35 / IMI 108563 / JCM 9778 / NBRC 8474) TaxID=1097556 RepID=R4XAG7_TAPDE|nr:Cytoplasmic tRNA 2-thiolation protein 2 [Taphrina deformans PYCC 5710]|eukprot:CCG81277.1 Cytoplasmic tRNA 2-thiolation protein 2 [Taphrina deformans PYCC 5710]
MERPLDDIDFYDTASKIAPESQPSEEVEQFVQEGMSLRDCITSLSSRTSQEDMVALYREKLILETAREHDIQAILFGDSATALAAKTLSLTAKGRGYALPWETADHSLSHNGIWNIRPLKGLMYAELLIYGRLVELPVSSPMSTKEGKANSIDHLTQRYFLGLEEQFPSLVATVVRTTNKLVEPLPRDQALGDCSICGMSYRYGARKWLRDITVSEAAPVAEASSGLGRCSPEYVTGPETLCYGCVVALRGSKSDMKWPSISLIAEHPLQSRNNDKKTVLNEFELG